MGFLIYGGDQVMTERPMPLKEEFIAYISREEEPRHAIQSHIGKHQVWAGAERVSRGLVSRFLVPALGD